jgi:hypothetical protein
MSGGVHSEVGWAYGVIYDDLHQCGCGYAEARLELVREVLRDCPLYDGTWRKYDTPLAEWLLCLMDAAGLIEHGGSIGGSWITEKGKRLLAVLEAEDAWTSLLNGQAGYCECPACGYVASVGG